ncbi:MAG: hypothetical protein H0W84_03245, partial [Bacteroidetes bacterium]|nr:hypothetical protein [Bacteroidota bacterium]
MKKSIVGIGLILITNLFTYAQEFKEVVQPLSPKAIKGFMYEAKKDENGNSLITYKIPGAKKPNEVFFEEYSFDKDMKFIGSKEVQEKKIAQSDYECTSYSAYVGGSTSFDVMNMKLKIDKVVVMKTWNYEKQRFVQSKYISGETIKPKNDNGKIYLGYASYSSADDKKSDLFILAKVDGKKNVDEKFYVLLFNGSLELKEKPLDLNGSYSLVFSEQVANEDVVMVFAPKIGSADVSKYVYFQFDIMGNLKNRIEFKSPASALLITSAYKMDDNIYFCGSSTKSDESYEKVFREYAPIYNPGVTPGGANLKDIYWQKACNEKMDNFHLLKFTGNQLTFASTTPVSEFKSKFKTAAGDKGASPYKGSKFFIEQFTVTPSGDYLIAGQLTSTVAVGTTGTLKSYEDVVCFHFDKMGILKAQYGVGKINNDKKSEVFPMPQNFYLSADGKKLFWEILEVKGTKGYESFLDAYNGNSTFYPLYFPRIGSIDLEGSSLNPFKAMGDGKYFLRVNFTSVYDKNEKSITYIGHD